MKLKSRPPRSENTTAKQSEQPANTRGDRAVRRVSTEESRCPLVNLAKGRTARRLQGTHGRKRREKNQRKKKHELTLKI